VRDLAAWDPVESLSVQSYLVTRFGVEVSLAAEVAQTLLEKSRRKTLGQLVQDLKGAPSVPDEISSRLGAFVEHRNWLIHRSQMDCRRALRTPAIGDEATAIQEVKLTFSRLPSVSYDRDMMYKWAPACWALEP
jgi:hypothetical protein